MTLPLTLLFFIDAASLRSGRYREVVADYHAKLGGPGGFAVAGDMSWHGLPRPHAYVRITDAEKPLLNDCVDALLEMDVKPIVEDGAQLRERGRTDMVHLLDRPELQAIPFTCLVRNETRIEPAAGSGATLFALLHGAVQTLSANHQILTIGFSNRFVLPAMQQQMNATFSVASSLRFPAVVRTRDLWLAALCANGQPAPFMGDPDAPMANVMGAFSPTPARFLCFNASIATTL